MAKGRITKRAVDAAKPGERDTYLWDADLSGFGLKATPAGRKVYLVQYRLGGRKGRTRRVTIGRHGSPWTPESARNEAKRLLGEVGAGRDPAEERTQTRGDLTIAELCDRYVAEGCATKKPSTVMSDKGRIECHIKPLLGRRRVTSISRPDVTRFLQDVASGKAATDMKTESGCAKVKGGRGVATRTVGLLGGIFTFAVEIGLRPDNPVRGVKRFKDKKFERFLSPSELAQLGDALSTAQQDGENPFAVAAIRLLVLTGARKSEILTLKWEYVDAERGCLRLPDSKTGAKVIPLGAAALETLSEITRVEGNPYVLPGGRKDRHFVDLYHNWERIRKRADLEDVRLHDLRHSFASVAVAGGSSLYLVGKVLGHEQANTTERYAHLADDPLKAVADKTASQIAAAMDNGNGGAEVVNLPKRNA